MIAISAGHYPDAKGAAANDFNEHDEAVLWAARLCHLLGPLAILVPTGTVRQKVDYINGYDGVEAAIEIHFNSDLSALGEGSETYYYPGSVEGEEIAKQIQSAIGLLFAPSRGVKEGWYRGDPDNGPIFFLQRTRCPAVIIEPEFIHNRDDITAKREAACVTLSEVIRRML